MSNNTKTVIILLLTVFFMTLTAYLVFMRDNDYEDDPIEIKVSNDTVYYTDIEKVDTSVPSNEYKITENPEFSVYWLEKTSPDGDDNCVLYDTNSKQVYSIRTITYKNNIGIFTSSTYYRNEKVNQEEAINFIVSDCWQQR